MLQGAPLRPSAKLAFVLRRRFEFLGALLVAALVPWAGLRWLITDPTFSIYAYHNSLIANVAAICMALWIRITISTYPGIRGGQLILPAIVASHATMVTLLLLSRLPYHRPSLAPASSCICCGLMASISSSSAGSGRASPSSRSGRSSG